VAIESAFERWTRVVVAEFDGVVLFDLPIPSTIYCVFLFPGALGVRRR
jgi:hypothetical protein